MMPPTNTPQINFNIITFSFSIFRGSQGFSLTSSRRTDRQKTCVAIQRRCLLVLCILLHPSHGSGYQKIYLPKSKCFFILLVHKSRKFHTNIHTLCIVHFHQFPCILHSPGNTFDNFHTAPYSLLLTLSQQ